MEYNNKGIIEQEIDVKDWHFGSVTGIDSPVLQEDGQWLDLPVKEIQKQAWGDTQACVSYSALNCLEALLFKKYGITANFSDRFLAKMSGTSKSGNSMRKVADTIRDVGLVFETEYPAEATSWEDYYKDILEEIKTKAEAFKSEYLVQYDSVVNVPKFIMEALKYSPLQIATYAYGELKDGIYQKIDKQSNHCMMLYGYKENEYWLVYDHYANDKKKFAWDYFFRAIYRFNIQKIMETIEVPQIPNNTLVQEVTQTGQFGLVLDNVIRTGTADKVIASFITRNRGNIGNKVTPLTLDDWNKFEKKPL